MAWSCSRGEKEAYRACNKKYTEQFLWLDENEVFCSWGWWGWLTNFAVFNVAFTLGPLGFMHIATIREIPWSILSSPAYTFVTFSLCLNQTGVSNTFTPNSSQGAQNTFRFCVFWDSDISCISGCSTAPSDAQSSAAWGEASLFFLLPHSVHKVAVVLPIAKEEEGRLSHWVLGACGNQVVPFLCLEPIASYIHILREVHSVFCLLHIYTERTEI